VLLAAQLLMGKQDVARYRANFRDEIDSAWLYRAMAGAARDTKLADIYQRLAVTEEKHAAFWEDKLREAGVTPPLHKPGLRSRVVAALARRFGAGSILPAIATRETVGRDVYVPQPEAKASMTRQEYTHARVLRTIEQSQRGGLEGGVLARLEGRHRNVGGNALRAAVLGANDGLCSNLALVMGVAGTLASSHALLITGIAGLLAGAFSMALGEWVSVTSSRELATREISAERAELAQDPESEAEELELIYQAKGLSPDEARSVARQMIADPVKALDALSREELGIDPEHLGGSAWQAAGTSFVLFAIGAAIPVIPFLPLEGNTAVAASIVVSAVALFAIGAGIALFTGRPVLYSGVRQLILGLAAAGVTYGLGRALGVAIG